MTPTDLRDEELRCAINACVARPGRVSRVFLSTREWARTWCGRAAQERNGGE